MIHVIYIPATAIDYKVGKGLVLELNRFSAVNKYRVERWCYLHHLKLAAWLIRCWIYLIHNSYVPYTCEIGEGTVFGYKGIGLVIHSDSKIGKNCVIGTNVTIGGGTSGCHHRIEEFDKIRQHVPVIGNGVSIATGAKILGPIVIGENAVIGANAVVLCDIPRNTVWGGGASQTDWRKRTVGGLKNELGKAI